MDSGRRRRYGKHVPLLMKVMKPKIVLLVLLTVNWNSSSGSHANSNSFKNFRLKTAQYSTPEDNPNVEAEDMRSPPVSVISDETALVGPFIGNAVPEIGEARKKKQNCGMPAIASRGFVGPTLKRTYFAYTPEEMEEKIRQEEGRQKREVKRNEISDGPLPWTCETKYEWKDMGIDHYPRFVRTAECKARVCFNGFFRCRPRRYKTKVLKKISGADSASCEEDDVSLPETLRSNWRFITVTINLCCDCTGRIPGTTEV